MTIPRRSARHQSENGSALVIAMVTLAVLAFAAAAISVSVSTSANVSLQAATWQESIMAAEAGADTAMASFRVALDEGAQNPTLWNLTTNALSDTKTGATAWAGWSIDDSYLLSGVTIPTKRSYSPVFRATTDGATGMQAKVTVEAPTAAAWTTSSGQWYRIRSTGIAGISGPPRVGLDKRDSDLRKISLVFTRGSRSGFPVPASLPTAAVTRSVELLVKPLPRGLWDRAITAGGPINMSAKFVVDSYDSMDASKSTNGFYDVAKRQSNADVASNDIGSHVKIGHGNIYGDLTYNTGTATGTDYVHGNITNTFYQQLVSIQKPTWGSYNNTPTSVVTTSATLSGGPASAPARYKLSDINLQTGNTLTFQQGNNGNGNGNNGAGNNGYTYIEIWVTNDVKLSQTGTIIVPDGFNVKFYIEGKFSASGSAIVNQTVGPNAAAALSLYGVDPGNTTTPLWNYGSDSDFTGTIYGPQVEFKVTSTANFYGAVLVNTVDFGGGVGAGFHFDEALLRGSSAGTPRYQIASWIEDVR